MHRVFVCFSDSLNLNTPVVPLLTTSGMHGGDPQVLEDIDDAIAVATGNLGLMPGSSFQARVSQLAELNMAHKTVSKASLGLCLDMCYLDVFNNA